MNKGWVCETCDAEAEYLPVVSSAQIRSWAAEHAATHRGHVVKLFGVVETFCQPPDTESQKLADASELQRLVSEAVMKERDRCLRVLATAITPTPKCSPIFMGPLEWVGSLKESAAEAIRSGSDQ